MLYSIELRDGDAMNHEDSAPTEQWWVESDLSAESIHDQIDEILDRAEYWNCNYELEVIPIQTMSLEKAKESVIDMLKGQFYEV